MCSLLGVSTSGYYDWLKRKPSKRKIDDHHFIKHIKSIIKVLWKPMAHHLCMLNLMLKGIVLA
jgi:hypothetical protein